NQNTVEGEDALFSLTTGADSTAMGFDALDSDTTGSDNAPESRNWSVTGSLNTARYYHTATLLQNGMVLVAGGEDSNFHPTASAELGHGRRQNPLGQIICCGKNPRACILKSEPIEVRSAFSTSIGDLNMKMFRLALAGALSAFVLLVCIQLNARVACTPPQPDAAAKVAAPSQSKQLSFEDRVAYQRAIEDGYWRHRIWPKSRPDPKPSLDAVMSQATIEKKVQDYLRNSELLEQDWSKPITPEQLQAEMERMAQHTKQPEVLHELFAALGNDPFVIAECL